MKKAGIEYIMWDGKKTVHLSSGQGQVWQRCLWCAQEQPCAICSGMGRFLLEQDFISTADWTYM